MTRYTTQSGSVYEVDYQSQLIRAVKGGSATKRITEEWRTFDRVRMSSTRALVVQWPDDNPPGTPEDDRVTRWTTTSPVVKSEAVELA